MATSTKHQTVNYSTFSVGNEKSKYLLTITGFSGGKGKIEYNNCKIYWLTGVCLKESRSFVAVCGFQDFSFALE